MLGGTGRGGGPGERERDHQGGTFGLGGATDGAGVILGRDEQGACG